MPDFDNYSFDVPIGFILGTIDKNINNIKMKEKAVSTKYTKALSPMPSFAVKLPSQNRGDP